MTPKVKPTAVEQKSMVPEEGLKFGQSVVLMDSNLRGKIVGLGKIVRIELEDGLVIESAYGEFAVTDKAEIASLKEAKVKAKKTSTTSRLSKPAVSADGSLTVTCTSKRFLEVQVFLKDNNYSFRWIPSGRSSVRTSVIEEERSPSSTA